MADRLEPILPGSYLGILGGGQLGRMFTQAAFWILGLTVLPALLLKNLFKLITLTLLH